MTEYDRVIMGVYSWVFFWLIFKRSPGRAINQNIKRLMH